MLKKSLVVSSLGIIVLFLTAMFGAGGASADEIKLTFASTMPPKSNLEIASEKFIRMVEEKTGGQVKITFYGAGSLHNDKTIIPAITKHQIDLGILHVALVGPPFPGARISGFLRRPGLLGKL